MNKNKQNKPEIIDATGQSLGRLATRVAVLLRGKNCPDFTYHQDKGKSVIIKNIDKIKITGRKLEQKEYSSYSGYPGGLKRKKIKTISPAAMLRKAVYGMLPKNKLRAKIIKRLIIKK